jgi:hypothetical protein
MNILPVIALSNLSVKLPLLILIGLYLIFIFLLWRKALLVNRIILLPKKSGTHMLTAFFLLYFLAVVSLFIVALVIV